MKLEISLRIAVVALLCAITPNGGQAAPAERTIGVFIALADNEHQGIAKVPAAIGNGDDPEKNLYWGTDEGLRGVFDGSNAWKLVATYETAATDLASAGAIGAIGQSIAGPNVDPAILRVRVYRNAPEAATMRAMAYRGIAIKECTRDFETAMATGAYDLVVYIGHDGLMDFSLPEPKAPKPASSASSSASPSPKKTDAVVLCCLSEKYFRTRIESAGARPILLTTQLMYPGAFILEAAAAGWLKGEGPAAIRDRAGAAYAKNQGISTKSGVGVFADLSKNNPAVALK